jgi:hypothetical protein
MAKRCSQMQLTSLNLLLLEINASFFVLAEMTFQLLKVDLMRCSQKYGYQYLLTDVATTQMVMPGVAPDPDIITYLNPIKIMDVYDDKLLKLAQKHSSLTWGKDSFTNQFLKVISDLTVTGGHLTTAGHLTQEGKDIIQGRLHSKILIKSCLCSLRIHVKSSNVSRTSTLGLIWLGLIKKWTE